ncbi:hypothetical protein QJS04_geneDACA017303 [Acorus gramineus]|uniref:Uncharacterized protein n=1 Tax=Acorus gramineus TaxID=55184 RepID=A0AAV9BE50_ACOGR|nr:hypothetical protein QJS04_geneDACA017303 [Acorus gramineus]
MVLCLTSPHAPLPPLHQPLRLHPPSPQPPPPKQPLLCLRTLVPYRARDRVLQQAPPLLPSPSFPMPNAAVN